MASMQIRRVLVNGLAYVAPCLSSKLSYAVWCRTQRSSRPQRELACFQAAKRDVLAIDGISVAVYHWGSGPPVLLVHGWNGRATQYSAFIESLVDANYSVIAFDAPGHGESGGGHTNIKQMSRIVGLLYERYGIFHGMIGHSFGFMVVVHALKLGVKSQQVTGVNSPANFDLLLSAFASAAGMNEKAEAALLSRIVTRYGLTHVDELSIPPFAQNLSSNKNRRLPCLIVHDKNDPYVPMSEASKIMGV